MVRTVAFDSTIDSPATVRLTTRSRPSPLMRKRPSGPVRTAASGPLLASSSIGSISSLHRSVASAWPAPVRSLARNPLGRSPIESTETFASGTPRPSRSRTRPSIGTSSRTTRRLTGFAATRRSILIHPGPNPGARAARNAAWPSMSCSSIADTGTAASKRPSAALVASRSGGRQPSGRVAKIDAPATGFPSGSSTCPRTTSESSRVFPCGGVARPAVGAGAGRAGSSTGRATAASPIETPAATRMNTQATARMRESASARPTPPRQGGDGRRDDALDRRTSQGQRCGGGDRILDQRRWDGCTPGQRTGRCADRPDGVERHAAPLEPAPQPLPCAATDATAPCRERSPTAARWPRCSGPRNNGARSARETVPGAGRSPRSAQPSSGSPSCRVAGSPADALRRGAARASRCWRRRAASTAARTATRRAMWNNHSPTDSRLRMAFALRTRRRNVAWKASAAACGSPRMRSQTRRTIGPCRSTSAANAASDSARSSRAGSAPGVGRRSIPRPCPACRASRADRTGHRRIVPQPSQESLQAECIVGAIIKEEPTCATTIPGFLKTREVLTRAGV